MRRFTRLTNAHSKKYANHVYALALYFMFYNFARIHMSLRVTPAMEAGISDHVWSMAEIVAEIDRRAPAPAPRGPYRKKGAAQLIHRSNLEHLVASLESAQL